MDFSFIELFIHTAHAAEVAHEATESVSGVAALGVNGTLFVAQLVNFTIIFFVLWRWVFKPIAGHLAERTQKIEQSLKDAALIREQKEVFTSWQAEQMKLARVEAAEIVGNAKQEAELLKSEILTKAKEEQQAIIASGHALLEREQEHMLVEAEQKLASLVVLATEKVLREKLTNESDAKLVAHAVQAVTTAQTKSNV